MKNDRVREPPLPPIEPFIYDAHWTGDILKLLMHIVKKQNEIDKKLDEIIKKLDKILESK